MATLQRTVTQLRAEKEASVTRLVKDLVELQRRYALESVQSKAIWAILRPEIREVEKAHEAHAEALEARVQESESLRSQETLALQRELGRVQGAVRAPDFELSHQTRSSLGHPHRARGGSPR